MRQDLSIRLRHLLQYKRLVSRSYFNLEEMVQLAFHEVV
jgi:hypothetical protein